MLKRKPIAIALVLALSAMGAMAANVTTSMTVTPANGPSWVENMTGLLVADAQNNFAMVQGDGTTGYFWGGQFISATQATVQRDYWQWAPGSTSSAGYWNWHSEQTLDGSSPATTDASTPGSPWSSCKTWPAMVTRT